MSRFSIYSLEVEDTSNACQLLAEKTRSVKMLIKYWTNFNQYFLMDIICRPMTDEIYAGLLFQLDLIRNQVTLITKMHADIVSALTPLPLSRTLDWLTSSMILSPACFKWLWETCTQSLTTTVPTIPII